MAYYCLVAGQSLCAALAYGL